MQLLARATRNDKLVAEGKADQVKAGAKGAASDIKDKLTGK